MTLPADDILLTLKDACEIFFGGAVTPTTLKTQSARGNLLVSKIGRSYFTTLADLKAMRVKCLVEALALDSGGTKSARASQSSTAESESARAAALAKISERKKLLGITSRRPGK